MAFSPEDREKRLLQLKLRIDEIHEAVLRALRAHDAEAIDRAMEAQARVMLEYNALLKEGRPEQQLTNRPRE